MRNTAAVALPRRICCRSDKASLYGSRCHPFYYITKLYLGDRNRHVLKSPKTNDSVMAEKKYLRTNKSKLMIKQQLIICIYKLLIFSSSMRLDRGNRYRYRAKIFF